MGWLWALTAVAIELTGLTSMAPLVACFGYCIIAVPFYTLVLNMYFRLGISLPERVKIGWARWIMTILFNFSDEDKEVVYNVLGRNAVFFSYSACFLQFDMLCHLFPALILLQKYASELTPLVCGQTALAFLVWTFFFHKRHLESVRLYETIRTGRLYFRVAPGRDAALSVGQRMQRQYLLTPALSRAEEILGLGAAACALIAIVILTYAGQNSTIANLLGLGGILPLHVLQTLYRAVLVTVVLTTAGAFFQIFFAETSVSSPTNNK